MTLSLVRATPTVVDPGDRVTSDGMWSLTHELGDDDDTGASRLIVVATHLATGLQLAHDLAGVDDWLMSGVALDELRVQAVSTFNGFALAEDKTAARDVLVKLDLLLPAGAVDSIESYCECGGYLALATGRRLIHVDACRNDFDHVDAFRADDLDPDDPLPEVVCDGHRVCLAPAAQMCEHSGCRSTAYPFAPPCQLHERCCGACCYGEDRD